jgi:hypothetical protein
MSALFEDDKQIGSPFPTEKEVWEAALMEGLVKARAVSALALSHGNFVSCAELASTRNFRPS